MELGRCAIGGEDRGWVILAQDPAAGFEISRRGGDGAAAFDYRAASENGLTPAFEDHDGYGT